MTCNGPFIGIVVNNFDPEMLGRVQITVPAVADQPLSWARTMTPSTGSGYGFYCLPEVGDEVLVEFLEGDFDQPLVLGGLWNVSNRPPTALPGQVVFRTRGGHSIVFDDAEGAEVIEIRTPGGRSIVLSDEADGRIELTNAASDCLIVIDDATGSVTIAAESGDIRLRAGSGVLIEGAYIQLKAAGQVAITAGSVSMQSEGATEIQGALLQIDGPAVLVNGMPIS